MKTMAQWLGTGAMALVLAACGGQKAQDEFAAGVPDVDGLTLEVQGGAAEGLSLAGLAPEASLAPLATPAPADGDDLAAARDRLKALNGQLETFVGTIVAAVQAEGAPALGDRMIYGPADRCVVGNADGSCAASATFVLGVKRERPRVFSFLLEARPVGSAAGTAFTPVAVGWLARGPQGHRGVGQLGLNLSALASVQPLYAGAGQLLAGFTNGPHAKSVHYRLAGFQPPGAAEAVTAAFTGFKTAAGVTRVRVAALEDLLSGPNGRELLLAHAAWLPGVGGRAYAVVSNWKALDRTVSPPVLTGPAQGDVPGATWSEQYWLGRACYTPSAAGPVLKFKEWFLCTRPGGPAACIVASAGTGTVVAGAGTWADQCRLATEPAELAPPAGAGDHADLDDLEPGQGGMAPPSAPGGTGEVTPPATDPATMM